MTLNTDGNTRRFYICSGLAAMLTVSGDDIYGLAFAIGELGADRSILIIDSTNGFSSLAAQ